MHLNKFNTFNWVISIIAFLLIAIVIPLQLNITYFIVLILLFFTTIFLGLHNVKSKQISTDEVKKREIFLSLLLNCSLFILLLFFINMLLFAKIKISINIFYIVFFYILIQNIFFPSPGFMIIGLSYQIERNVDKLKVLCINCFNFSIPWLVLFSDTYQSCCTSEMLDSIMMIFLLLNLLNVITWGFVYKNNSLLRKILKIHIVKVNKARRK